MHRAGHCILKKRKILQLTGNLKSEPEITDAGTNLYRLAACNIVVLLLDPIMKYLTQDYQLLLYGNYSVFVDKEVSCII